MCHVMVLLGNLMWCDSFDTMGDSTQGWSRVGQGLGRGVHDDIDAEMVNVSDRIVEAIEQTQYTFEVIEEVLSEISLKTDHIVTWAISQSAYYRSSSWMLKVQELDTSVQSPWIDAPDGLDEASIRRRIAEHINETSYNYTETIAVELDTLMEILEPALWIVGDWLVTFGDEVQAGLQQATVSLDKVQKLFDSIMEQLNGRAGGDDKDIMVEQTFALFDVSGTGQISVQDLQDVSDLYSIGALEGDKAQEMVDDYDYDQDKEINYNEFQDFVEDDKLDNIMSTVLRVYAERLAEIGGIIGEAEMRSEVSGGTVDYLALVAAKNYTKVTWISDALSNGSLAMEFTASVFAELCLKEDDPNKLTEEDIGALVIGCMYDLNETNTLEAFDLMSDAAYWLEQGFDYLDQPKCVARVQQWLDWAEGNVSDVSLTQIDLVAKADRRLALKAQTQRRMRSHLLQRRENKIARHQALFSGQLAQLLRNRVFGTTSDGGSGIPTPADRAVSSGVPALNSTLEWAGWLSNNATVNADIYQEMCFDYSSTSSNNLETIGAKFEGMVNNIKGFLDIMYDYSTAKGIGRLEDMIIEFRAEGLFDIQRYINESLHEALDEVIPTLEEDLHRVGSQWVSQRDADPAAAGTHAMEHVRSASVLFTDVTDAAAMLARTRVTEKLRSRFNAQLFRDEEFNISEGEEYYSDEFQYVIDTLDGLLLTLPVASDMVREARSGASKTSSTLKGIFNPFEKKGPKIFADISDIWRIVWILETGFFVPLTVLFLFYGFWVGGFCGGPGVTWTPKPPDTDDEEEEEPAPIWRPTGFCEKCCHCCTLFCNCCAEFHDSQTCFWVAATIMQIVVLLLFIVSILLVIVAGVQASITAGCEQVYVLNDLTVCTELVGKVKNFTGSFYVSSPDRALEDVCDYNSLTTCDDIKEELMLAILYTTVFSFLGTVLSLEMIFTTAQLHERARFRRMLVNHDAEKDALEAASAAAPGGAASSSSRP